MVECTRRCGLRSPSVLELPSVCRCSRVRVAVLFLFVSATFIFYYVTSPDLPSAGSDGIYSSTSGASKAAPSVPVNASAQEWPPILISGREVSDSPPPLSQVCTPETRYIVPYPCDYRFILNEPGRCKSDDPFLVLMVPVAPHNKKARDAVRKTWGSEKRVMDKAVSLFFLLGLPKAEQGAEVQQRILRESEKHHDIIQSDFVDSYKNLTIKTMIIMEWLATHCQSASYAMKIDSDIFLNVRNLIYLLLQAPRENYMTGHVVKGAMVLRDSRSKWYLPKEVFAEDIYPSYALGLGYVVSMDLPKKLIEGAKDVTPVYIEDVFLGLCMRHIGVRYTHPPDLSLFHVIPVPYSRCSYSKLIATTTQSQEEQVDAWKDLRKPGPTCEPETKNNNN